MTTEAEPREIKENICYFKLPFMGKFSKFTRHKLQKLSIFFK